MTKDLQAQAELMFHLGDSQVEMVRRCNTSAEIWTFLRNSYLHENLVMEEASPRKLLVAYLAENQEILKFLDEWRMLLDNALLDGLQFDSNLQAMLLLPALPSSWRHFITMQASVSTITVESLRASIRQEKIMHNGAYNASGAAPTSSTHNAAQRQPDFQRGILLPSLPYASASFFLLLLALLGCFDWRSIPPLLLWLMLFLTSTYEMSSWVRTYVVPLIIRFNKKTIFPIRIGSSAMPIFDELFMEGFVYNAIDPMPSFSRGLDWRANYFLAVDYALKGMDYLGVDPFWRHRLLTAAEKWMLKRQEDNGNQSDLFPATFYFHMGNMFYSLLSLHTSGSKPWYRLDLSFLLPHFNVVASAGGLLCCTSEERVRINKLNNNNNNNKYNYPPFMGIHHERASSYKKASKATM